MINQDEDLRKYESGFISQQQAKQAIQECLELKNENKNLRNQFEKVKAKNDILKVSKRQLEELKKENEELEKKLQEFQETMRLHSQYTSKGPNTFNQEKDLRHSRIYVNILAPESSIDLKDSYRLVL